MKNKLITRFYLKNRIVCLRLTINGERAEVSTNSRINPVLWNKLLRFQHTLMRLPELQQESGRRFLLLKNSYSSIFASMCFQLKNLFVLPGIGDMAEFNPGKKERAPEGTLSIK